MKREHAPENVTEWFNNLTEKSQWQVYDSAWIWTQLRSGSTIKKSMGKAGYSPSSINKVLTRVDVTLRNAENKKDSKPTVWKSRYDNDYQKLEVRVSNFWEDENSYKNFPGLCCYIEVDKDTYKDSIMDERVPPEIIAILKREKLQIEAYQINKIHESPAGGIFNLKNNHGYRDKRELAVDNTFEVVSVEQKLMDQSNKILKGCELELNPEDIEEIE